MFYAQNCGNNKHFDFNKFIIYYISPQRIALYKLPAIEQFIFLTIYFTFNYSLVYLKTKYILTTNPFTII